MARAGLQRTLAAAGLSLVTGTAAVGLAIVGVGPLGEVAASVRGAGAAMSRGVLSVVMPEQAPASQPEAPGGDSSAARAPRPSGGSPEERGDVPPKPPAEAPAKPAPADLPDADTSAPDADTLVETLTDAVLPTGAHTSADESDGKVLDVLGHLNGLTSGVLR